MVITSVTTTETVPSIGDVGLRGSRTTAVEQSLVAGFVNRTQAGRLLDVGGGTGRLLPLFLGPTANVVSLDLSTDFLKQARGAVAFPGRVEFVRADALRLPFPSASFSSVVAIRVIHRVADPTRLLMELRRVLKTRGTLILSFHPRPSWKTIEYDVWSWLKSPTKSRRLTFPSGGSETIHPSGDRGHVTTRPVMLRAISDAGFEMVEEVGCGIEDLPVFHRLPSSLFVRCSHGLGRAPWTPTRIALLRAV